MDKNKIITILSLIPVIIILFSTFSSEITKSFILRENSFLIPMVEKDTNEDEITFYSLQEYLSDNLYIPNYDSKINVMVDNYIDIDKSIKFRVKIDDTGILPMDDQYYYIYLLDSSKKIRGCFPECNFKEKDMEKWSIKEFTVKNQLSKSEREKKASTKSQEYYKTSLVPYTINGYEFGFETETLTKGFGNILYELDEKNNDIYYKSKKEYTLYYSFPADVLGDWEIYVISLNSKYMDRKGQEILFENGKSKIVNFEKKTISVMAKEKSNIVTFLNNHFYTIIFIIKILAAFFGSIFTYYKARGIITKHFRQIMNFIDSSDVQKRLYIAIIIILILLLIMQYFIMKG